MQRDVCRLGARAERVPCPGGDAGGIPQARPVPEVREEQPARGEDPRDLAQPLHRGEGRRDLPAGIRVEDDEVGAGGSETGHALLPA